MQLKALTYAASIILAGSFAVSAQAKDKKGGKKGKAKSSMHCVEADGTTEAMDEGGKPLDSAGCKAKEGEGFKWTKK